MKFEKIENLALTFTAVFSILLCGATVMSIVLLAGLLSEFAAAPLHAQTKPAVELAAAMTKEQVDGDLKTAIAAYQKIGADKSAPRDVRAKALLHLAGCYEKLGQQAQSVYQQIVRDFPDQAAAVQARARLAVLKQDDHPAAPVTMTQRKIETPGSVGPGDTDGHHVVYLNKATGELIYGDLSGKSKRVILKAKLDNLPGWFPSRDFSIVGLQFQPKPDQPGTYAVINTDGTGYREIARVNGSNGCWNWSWNNRYILLCSQSRQGTIRLLRISVADGQIRELLSLRNGTVRAATFSPDGRFVAYQMAPISDTDPVSRIFVLPAEGGEPQLAYEERPTSGFSRWNPALKLLDWTADGLYLAIGSERTGKGALHLVPIRDGKSAGVPVFLRYGDFEDGVTTAAGGLVYTSLKPGGAWSVYLASLDANGRPGGWKHLDLHLGNMANPWPEWSGDGNQIVYIAGSQDAGQTGGEVVRLHNLSTGEDREIHHALGRMHCSWSVLEPKLFCDENAMGKTEIISIAVDSGEIERLHTFTGPPLAIIRPSRDDRALYMLRLGDQGEAMLRWDILAQRETILVPFPDGWVSPDERWFLRFDNHNFETRPTSGGDWKPLVSLKWGFFTGHANFTPDGNWLLYHNVDSAGKHDLFRVATAGGQPERLGDFPTSSQTGSLEVSPDGRNIVVSADEYVTRFELWSLENFVPPAPKP